MMKRGVASELYLVSWFQTLFVYLDPLPMETIQRVWDIFMYEKNWKIFFRTALALVKIHEQDILMGNMEEIIQILVKLPRYNALGPDELMDCAMSFKVGNVDSLCNIVMKRVRPLPSLFFGVDFVIVHA